MGIVRQTLSSGRRATLRALLAVALTAHGGAAAAQDLNYSTSLFGARAMGMGGTGTGYSVDSSALFYNPAGLAHLGPTDFSGSFSVNAYERVALDNAFANEYGADDLVYAGNPAVPIFAAVMEKFGPADEDGVRVNALAAGALYPRRIASSFRGDIGAVDLGARAQLALDTHDAQIWYGLAYARRLSPVLALGISGFIVRRTFDQEEQWTGALLGDLQPDGTYRNSIYASRRTTAELDAWLLAFGTGVLWDPSPHWRVGAMFRPPSIQLGGTATLTEVRLSTDLRDGEGRFFEATAHNLHSETVVPWQLRLGAAYYASDALVLAADLSAYGPQGSRDDPVVQVDVPEAGGPGAAPTPVPGSYLIDRYWANRVVNVAVGLQWIIDERFPLRAGLFTDFSGAPTVREVSNDLLPAHIDNYGASLSFSVRTGAWDLGMGAVGVLGFGQGYQYASSAFDELQQGGYRAVDARASTLYFFISGASGTAERLAHEVTDDWSDDRTEGAQTPGAASEGESPEGDQDQGSPEPEPGEVPPDGGAQPR